MVGFQSVRDYRFQSTFPRGERREIGKTVFLTRISIHVPAWGTTFFNTCYTLIVSNFNPRSRVGNDGKWVEGYYYKMSISIHVPAWGTTIYQPDKDMGYNIISIHVPAWGTTVQHLAVN